VRVRFQLLFSSEIEHWRVVEREGRRRKGEKGRKRGKVLKTRN